MRYPPPSPRASLARAAISLILALAFSFGIASPAFAAGGQTGNLNGVLVDAATHNVVANARITAASPSGRNTATTDAHGFFSLIGLPVDTYTISVEATGYETVTLQGVTVQGDQTVNLGNVSISKRLQEIGRTQARSASSNFQRSQTVDSYTITGDRVLQTTGKAAATNENDLLLAVPGVSLTNTGNATIRGGLRTEVGYQFDGVNFTEPFFSQNGGLGQFAGLGTLQVVEGAGDATQGNVGGGVINLIPKRGTFPATGLVDVEAGGPNYYRQFNVEYGFATPNGRISDYFAYNAQRGVPYQAGAAGPQADVSQWNAYYGTGYQTSDIFVNNFVYKFGKDNNQSLQILYLNQNLQQYGGLGGPGTYYPYDPANPFVADFGLPTTGPYSYANTVGLNPDTNLYTTTTPGLLQSWNPTRYLKFEYDNNFSANTFLQARYYNWESLQCSSNDTGTTAATYGNGGGIGAYPTENCTGGPRVGIITDLTHQFSEKHIVTLNAQYEVSHPIWNNYDPDALYYLLAASPCSGGPCLTDFTGGYLSGYFPNGTPRVPVSGINYNGAFFQTMGLGLRWQYNPNARLHFDLGVREDQQRQHYGFNPYNPTEPGNPSDVDPSTITSKYLDPVELQPRAAVSYSMGPNDAVRFGYGRSVVFLNAQTTGTPAGMYGAGMLEGIPAKPGFTCGSGHNSTYTVPCQNYAQELYWLYDQNFDAPDLGGGLPSIYSNYDFTYQHLFRNGWAMKVTPFYKLGTDLPSFALVRLLASGAAVFTVNNEGVNRTTGAEFGLNTPDRANGLSGFLSMTYQNVLQTTPPLIGGEDALPINGSGSLALGDLYRAGYVSPFDARIGLNWKHYNAQHNGFRISPVLQYDRGYPYNVGNVIASSGNVYPGSGFQNIPQVNFGPGQTQISSFQGTNGSYISTNYYDPAYSGNSVHPNIDATRGTPQSQNSGGVLWNPNLEANLVLEYKHDRSTFGVQFINLFGNAYNGQIPFVNPYYQPVANGISGPQTGKNVNPGLTGFANLPKESYAFDNGAYLLFPLRPFSTTVYYQFAI